MLPLTSCHADEVFSRSLVDFYVSIPDVVLVPPDGHVTMSRIFKQDESFAVATALITQAECNATSEIIKKHFYPNKTEFF